MPRLARLDAPGVLHHIMIRGTERRKIFLNQKDYEDFIERLAMLLPEMKTACYAWVLMPNHAHFLFCTGTAPLARLMRRLLTGYAVSFNGRHQRHGHLFQNRYKSIICQEDAYLRELVRYIHLNPVRASIVSAVGELNGYAYCGHSALMGRKKRSWQDAGYVLTFFGKTVRAARKAYAEYVAQGVEQGRREELTGGGLIRSLGGGRRQRDSGGGEGSTS
jgi:putative transposase